LFLKINFILSYILYKISKVVFDANDDAKLCFVIVFNRCVFNLEDLKISFDHIYREKAPLI